MDDVILIVFSEIDNKWSSYNYFQRLESIVGQWHPFVYDFTKKKQRKLLLLE